MPKILAASSLAILLCGATSNRATAQAAPPAPSAPTLPGGPAAEVQRSFKAQRDNILKSAEKMPEADYSFKAMPDIRSYARILNHVIEAQVRSCGAVNHTTDLAKTPSDTAPKAEIIAALKASFDECDKAFGSATDANVLDTIPVGKITRTRITLLWGTVSHDNEQYSQLALYLRLKGIVPPTSEK